MKKKHLTVLMLFLSSCIHQMTCEEDFSNNNHVEFKNFEFDHFNLISHSERILVGKNKVEILLVGNLGGRLHDALISGDILTKNKNENIVIVQRKNMSLRLEMCCKDDVAELKIDTFSHSQDIHFQVPR